jgi:hypothetical protein
MMKKCLFAQHITIDQVFILTHIINKRHGGLVKPYFVPAALPPEIKYDGYVERVTDYLAERLDIYASGAIDALNHTTNIDTSGVEFRNQP